jgi:hypothetical protein
LVAGRDRKPVAPRAMPEAKRAEGLGGNAGASRRDSLKMANFILERSALNENIRIFVEHLIPLCARQLQAGIGFCFLGEQ